MNEQQVNELWSHLHWLTVLAQQGSYTAAAARLGVSKAAMSQHMADLERKAGVTLVRRTTRSVGLTEAGQQLVAELEPAFARINDSYSSVRDLVGAPRGLIRVTAPVALGRQHLGPCVASFLQRFPDITVELALTDRFVNLPSEGFDLAIRHTSVPPETHQAWALCDTRSVLLASPAYLARRGTPSHPSELAQHDCLLYLGQTGNPARASTSNWTFERHADDVNGRDGSRSTSKNPRQPLERFTVPVNGPLKANNSEVLRDALLAGLGMALLPDFSQPLPSDNAHSPLVRVLPGWRVQGFFGEHIYALRAWSPQVPKSVECFVAHLRENFARGFGPANAQLVPPPQ